MLHALSVGEKGTRGKKFWIIQKMVFPACFSEGLSWHKYRLRIYFTR